MGTISDYREAGSPLPKTYQAWQIFGAGFDNIGKDGKPIKQVVGAKPKAALLKEFADVLA